MAALSTPRIGPLCETVPGPSRSYRVVSEFEHSSVTYFYDARNRLVERFKLKT